MTLRRAASTALLILAVLPSSAAAAPAPADSPPGAWAPIDGPLAARSTAGRVVETQPARFAAFALDQGVLRQRLATAPSEDARRAGKLITLPAPDGSLQLFRAVESPVIADGLAERFPQIRTYAAEGVDDPTATARFDVTPLGFRASVQSESGLWYVDPYYRNDPSAYVAYFRSALERTRSPLSEPQGAAELLEREVRRAVARRAPGDQVTKRTYRLALTNDPSYAEYFGASDLLVESAKASLMNRVNQLYNDDLAIRMELIADDFKLNFQTDAEFAAAGYSTGGCSSAVLDENQVVIDATIGDANYDIGHIVGGVDFDGGGVALLESVGKTGEKAQGCTGLDPPVGDGFAIDYVAHEMGHQYGGPHTFDGASGSCAPPNRDLFGEASVEPGSGTSIQAYAGICETDNLQPNSDPYFSQQSIDDILGYVESNVPDEEEEGTETTVSNRSPIVTAPPDRTIPYRTPFTLTGDATDPDSDGLVYTWEQDNSGFEVAQPIQNTLRDDGPLFRMFSFRAVEDPLLSPAPGQNIARGVDRVRSFPDAAQVAADNTNAETGLCPGAPVGDAAVDCQSEVLPTQAYTPDMNFRLTARDRDPTGGGVSHDDVVISLAGTLPFAVTGPAAAPLVGNGPAVVTWNAAGTTAAPFNVPNVRISYSTDGGLTFGYEVVASTANDGTEAVTVPNVATTTGRFKVEAIDNYFFDVSDANLTVTVGAGSTPTATATPSPEPSPAPTVDPLPVPGLSTATPTSTPTSTATFVPTPTPTRQPPEVTTPTPTASASATATGTATPIASATIFPSPTATAGPSGFLAPDVAGSPRSVKVKGNRKLRAVVRCAPTGSPAATRCVGTLGLFAKIDDGPRRRIARARLSIPRGVTRTVVLRLSRRSFAFLGEAGTLEARLRARANRRVSAKTVTLKR